MKETKVNFKKKKLIINKSIGSVIAIKRKKEMENFVGCESQFCFEKGSKLMLFYL